VCAAGRLHSSQGNAAASHHTSCNRARDNTTAAGHAAGEHDDSGHYSWNRDADAGQYRSCNRAHNTAVAHASSAVTRANSGHGWQRK